MPRMYLSHNSSQYRCQVVLALSFPGVQMLWCTYTVISKDADASVFLVHHSRLLMPECIRTIVSGRQMPLFTRTIIPQSTNAKLYSTVYLHHHFSECRC